MKKFLLILLCLAILVPKTSYSAISPKKQVKIILYTGLYGAVLGLSTLSFYNKPGDHARNIAIGGALGLIASVAISTVLATKEDKQRIQTELLNQGSTNIDAKGNKVDKKTSKKKSDDPDAENIDEVKDGATNKNDPEIDDFEDDEEDEYEDEEIINYNETNKSLKLFFAEFTNSNVYINPDFMVFYENPNNRKIDVYAKIIDFRF